MPLLISLIALPPGIYLMILYTKKSTWLTLFGAIIGILSNLIGMYWALATLTQSVQFTPTKVVLMCGCMFLLAYIMIKKYRDDIQNKSALVGGALGVLVGLAALRFLITILL